MMNKNSEIKKNRAQNPTKNKLFDQALEPDGDVHRRDRHGKTALFYARNIPEVEFLLSKGAKLDVMDCNGQTILHQNLDIPLAQFFLNRISALERKDGRGDTPLMSAVRQAKNLDLTKLYLSSGSDPFAKSVLGQNLLHIGALNKACPAQKDLIMLILGCGIDVNMEDWQGQTALHIASQFTNDDPCPILRMLIENGADVHARNASGQTALHMHLNSLNSVLNLNVAKLLLEAGVEPNAQDKNGDTAFHLVFDQKPMKELVELLFEFGMDFDLENEDLVVAHTRAGLALYPFIQTQTSKINIQNSLKNISAPPPKQSKL